MKLHNHTFDENNYCDECGEVEGVMKNYIFLISYPYEGCLPAAFSTYAKAREAFPDKDILWVDLDVFDWSYSHVHGANVRGVQ